ATVAPRGDTVSPRCNSGQLPVRDESNPRSHATTPFPPSAPCNSTPLVGAPPQRLARAGASNRTVSFGARVTRACTRPDCSGALPQAAPTRASPRAAVGDALRGTLARPTGGRCPGWRDGPPSADWGGGGAREARGAGAAGA